MEAQELYDFIANHLFTQGRPASARNGRCKYRLFTSTKVLKCAVGCIIPDDVYDTVLEDQSVTDLVRTKGLFDSSISKHVKLLQELQITHDHATTNRDGTFEINDLTTSLGNIAKLFNLIPYVHQKEI